MAWRLIARGESGDTPGAPGTKAESIAAGVAGVVGVSGMAGVSGENMLEASSVTGESAEGGISPSPEDDEPPLPHTAARGPTLAAGAGGGRKLLPSVGTGRGDVEDLGRTRVGVELESGKAIKTSLPLGCSISSPRLIFTLDASGGALARLRLVPVPFGGPPSAKGPGGGMYPPLRTRRMTTSQRTSSSPGVHDTLTS